ncbi:hypothetical protein [Labrenzia sp. 011]|uniref:hypothetical protein n=1 Tax=Labrenzia sp. 011 TaxID=2171494 RepID=UPI000D514D3F|nr:hypothetical protein [Labrenzia sp. 011]PVB63534.1 hypothetical protein DCO57_01700 [Labrenzia sp. 011]
MIQLPRFRQFLAVAVVLTTALSLAPARTLADDWSYMDDRSTPEKLIESYYYAINNKFYVQAYSYFQPDMAPADFGKWAKGYADTETVSVKLGSADADPGAGQIYWNVPVVLSARKTDGSSKVFTGCYRIHMTNLGMQTDPPYQPMGIVSATLKEANTAYDKAAPGSC